MLSVSREQGSEIFRHMVLGAMLAGVFLCASAAAAERKVYKYVDEKGNVVYSQTPPADGREAKKVDASPAAGSRGGYVTSPSGYQTPYRESAADRQAEMMREKQRRAEEARQKRLEELEAECLRNRGTDCKNPETLRLIESQRIPRRRY